MRVTVNVGWLVSVAGGIFVVSLILGMILGFLLGYRVG